MPTNKEGNPVPSIGELAALKYSLTIDEPLTKRDRQILQYLLKKEIDNTRNGVETKKS